MPLTKSRGNMYEWVTHTHNHLGGACPHGCWYCYVDNPRFGRPDRYKGDVRLIESELLVNYGKGKTIFVENMSDLFAAGIHPDWIHAVLYHCRKYPENHYVIQTKNPGRVLKFLDLPKDTKLFTIGTTVESDMWHMCMNESPHPEKRIDAIREIRERSFNCFITVEPILKFTHPKSFSGLLAYANPSFINIGADSKGKGLSEPSEEEVASLITLLKEQGMDVRLKSNLFRILKSMKK